MYVCKSDFYIFPINVPEYETMITLQKRIDYLQNEVASKDVIIKMLIEMQIGILDSGTNCTSQDNITSISINITDDSFIPVNNSKHKRNYDQNKKNKEKTNSVNADQELSDINQNRNQTTYTNRDISEKKQSFIGNYTVIQLRRIYTNSLV